MGRSKLLLVGVLIAALTFEIAAPQAALACPVRDCGITGELGVGGADLSGTSRDPGSSGGGPVSGGGTGAAPATPVDPDACPLGRAIIVNGLRMCLGETEMPSDSADLALGSVVIADVAHFPATPPRQRMQPDGWTVVGLPTNFYAVTGSHIASGTLLGHPAEVRFTPVAYHWRYGDGETATRTTPGGSWQALGVAEFDRTPTSHVFDAEGVYVIRLSVDFAAEYRVAAGPWLPIAGLLALPADDLRVAVGSADTVLVADDCRVDSAGPGCR